MCRNTPFTNVMNANGMTKRLKGVLIVVVLDGALTDSDQLDDARTSHSFVFPRLR